MKKLVMSVLSKQHHDGADKQGRERQQTENCRDEDAPDRQRHAHQGHAPAARLQDRRHVVQATHREGHDEHRQGHEHQQDAPIGSRCALHDCLRWIERPACACRTAGHKEAGNQDDDRQQVDPVAEHVQEREHHVTRTAHQRDQVISKTTQEQGGQQIDHHDHAVHGDELVIILGIDKRKLVRETELQAHHRRQAKCNQANEDRSNAVLNGNDLVILAPDVLGNECLRIVVFLFVITIGDCNVRHRPDPIAC